MPSAFVATYGSGSRHWDHGELDALPGISNKAVPYKDHLVEGGRATAAVTTATR